MSHLEQVIAARGYLPRWLFDRVMADEDPESAVTISAAVLMVDMAGFSELTNRLAAEGRVGPEAVLEHLNRWFGRVIEPVQKEGGDIVSFGGDCFTAIFHGRSSTEDLGRAARAAFAVQRATEVPTHIGISHGPVKLGLAGTKSVYRPYALGDSVSGAAEAMNRARPGEVWSSGCFDDLAVIERHGDLARLAPLSAAEPALRSSSKREEDSEATATASIGDPRLMASAIERLRPLLPEEVWDGLLLPSVSGEHAVVTTLFLRIDVDCEEEAERILFEVLPEVTSADGYVNKIDSAEKGIVVLSFFGAPRGLEDAETRGIRVARSLVRRSPCAAVLTTGRLFIGDLGSTTRHELTAVGAPVNRAARILQATPTGEVHCDRSTAEEAVNFRFLDGPVVRARGFSEPLSTFVLGGEGISEGAVAADPVPLIGRDEPMMAIDRHLRGPSPSLLVLEGEMGMGKSRLLREIAANFRAEGVTVAYGIFGVQRPFSALGQVSESLGLPPPSDGETLLRGLRARFSEPGSKLLILLDDAQLASEDDKELWKRFETLISRFSVPVVVARRPGQGLCEKNADVVIGPLNSSDGARLARLVNESLDANDALSLSRLSGGSPLFLERLARHGQREEEGLPHSVEAVVKARFAGLPVMARRVLAAGAVLGNRFQGALLFSLVPEVGEVQMSTALDLFVKEGFLLSVGADYSFTHDLERAAAYDSLSRMRARALHRIALDHLLRMPGIVPLEILHHAKGTGDDETWTRISVDAADAAISRRSRLLAVRIAQEPKARIEDARLLVRLDAVEARAEQLAGNHLEAARLLPKVIERAEELGLTEMVVLLSRRLAETASQLSDYDTSEKAIVKGLEDAALLSDIRDVEGELLRVRGWNAWGKGDYPSAASHLAGALLKVQPDGFGATSIRVALAAVRTFLGDLVGAHAALPDVDALTLIHRLPVYISRARIAFEQADFALVKASLDAGNAILDECGEGIFFAHLVGVQSILLEMEGRFLDAGRRRREAESEHRKGGRRYDALFGMTQEVMGAIASGRVEEARIEAGKTVEEAEALEAVDEVARGKAHQQIAACLLGEMPRPTILAELQETAERTARFDLMVETAILRALMSRTEEEREAQFERVLALCRERGAHRNERFVRIVRYRAALARGATASELRLRELEERLEEWGCPRWTWPEQERSRLRETGPKQAHRAKARRHLRGHLRYPVCD